MKLSLPLLLASGALLAQSEPRTPQEPSRGDTSKAIPAPTAPNPMQQPSQRRHGSDATEDKAATPTPTPAAVSQALAKAQPTQVLFDQPIADGELWALGANYKASFAADSWTFVPQPSAQAPAASPLRFRLTQVTTGGKQLPLQTTAAASRTGNRVALDRGAVVEAIDLSLTQVEQTFTFTSLRDRGELVLTIGVATELAGSANGTGLRFGNAWNEVTYSGAVAIDADGDRIAVATDWVDGHIQIRVPQAFVAAASLPLVIDPVVASTVVQAGSNDVGNADIVYATDAAEWHVSYNQFFANGDWDCYVQRLSATFAPVGTRTTIDFTSGNIFAPKIAHIRGSDVSMVVAENRLTPIKVVGRIMDNAGAVTTGMFDITSTSVNSVTPDIGGDPYSGSSYFTIVWDHAFSAIDHDVYCRQVTSLGVLRGTGPTVVQGNILDQRNPSISKSCGASGSVAERNFIVYQQLSAGQWDIHGAMLTYDGAIITVGGANTFPIDTSLASNTWPQVSTPTPVDSNGERRTLVVYTNEGLNAGDIEVASLDMNGNVMLRDNLLDMEGRILAQTWLQGFASVDSDGSRFVVAYHELYSGAGIDFDARVTLVTPGSNELFAYGSTAQGLSAGPEFAVQVGSRYSSSGQPDDGVGLCNDFDASPVFRIEADLYQTVPQGTVAIRTTSCGGDVSISSVGNAIPGGTVTFSLANLSPIAGFAVGDQANILIPGCPSCTLGVSNYTTLIGNTLPVTIPTSYDMFGVRLSFQGWMLGTATPTSCLGAIHLSDTLDLLVR